MREIIIKIYFALILIEFATVSWSQTIQLKEHIEPCQKSENLSFTDESPITLNTFKHGIIQSPNYPAPYSKDENCIFSLKAPKNYVIVLKSLEKFSLEQSDGCVNDYLEIRDGKYGYSPLIGKFCDSQLPELPIESSGQHMWIRFDSDDSIQSDGFKIIYEWKMISGGESTAVGIQMINRMSRCEMEILPRYFEDNAYGLLTNSDMESLYYTSKRKSSSVSSADTTGLTDQPNYNRKPPDSLALADADDEIDCTIHIQVEATQKIFVWIEQINITLFDDSSSAARKALDYRPDCTKNFLELYDGSTAMKHQRHHFCSSETNKFFKSQTNNIFIRYNLEEKVGEANTVYFKLSFNPFEIGECNKNGTFHCSDNTCINETLVCNGVKNCNYLDDELNCRGLIMATSQRNEQWTYEQKIIVMHKIIISTLGFTLGVIIIISVTVSCRHSVKKNDMREKEISLLNHYKPVRQNSDVDFHHRHNEFDNI